jgi:A/G-specific adenine glycosylase
MTQTQRMQDRLLAWYARYRRGLPWRNIRDPYSIWLSEVMLQQTRVDTVVPYYRRFLAAYPSVHALAEAPLENVLRLWSGLGYYRRARMLHEGARAVLRIHGGALPRTASELLRIPGIGRYTAGAIASIVWDEVVPAVDGNVARVLSRVFALDSRTKGGAERAVWQHAHSLVAATDPSSWNQALMELGATVCSPRKPKCAECPFEADCLARIRGLTEALPRARSKKAPTIMPRVGFVLRCHGRILLGRRHAEGMYGGMWEPPHGDPEHARSIAERLVAEFGRVTKAGSIRHVLSHRRIEMDVYEGEVTRGVHKHRFAGLPDYDRLRWLRARDVEQVALTALARKILATRTPQKAAGPSPRESGG